MEGGNFNGQFVGSIVGNIEGIYVGFTDGTNVGVNEGCELDGISVGSFVGTCIVEIVSAQK